MCGEEGWGDVALQGQSRLNLELGGGRGRFFFFCVR